MQNDIVVLSYSRYTTINSVQNGICATNGMAVEV